MKFWYDTEFIEDGKTVDLISIGVVSEDGREFYAVSTEFKARKANQWVKDNELIHLPERYPQPPPYGSPRMCEESLAWKPRKQIKADLLAFCDVEKYGKPEFWGYYSAYDHVALCQLFGTMMELPKGWPMYTRDIKQWCDALGNPRLPEQGKGEHHALADARWNRDAYLYLQSVAQPARP